VAYRGYGLESGKLYYQSPPGKTPAFFLLRSSYQQRRPATFLRRLQVSFAIGQAF
jgi:hypothetical protein